MESKLRRTLKKSKINKDKLTQAALGLKFKGQNLEWAKKNLRLVKKIKKRRKHKELVKEEQHTLKLAEEVLVENFALMEKFLHLKKNEEEVENEFKQYQHMFLMLCRNIQREKGNQELIEFTENIIPTKSIFEVCFQREQIKE